MSSSETSPLISKWALVAKATATFKRSITALRTKKTPTYKNQSHVAVITQSYGSVYNYVLPYCFANVILTLAVVVLRDKCSIDLSIDFTGHKLLSTLVSFYMIGITTTIINRYMEARTYLGAVYWASMDLASMTCLFTMADQSEKAKKWRSDVIYHLLILLVGITGASEYSSAGHNIWDLKDMPKEARERIKRSVFRDNMDKNRGVVDPESKANLYLNGQVKTMLDDNLRVPTFLAYDLRQQITSWRRASIFETDLHVNEERDLLVHVGVILKNWDGLKTLVQTPLPFPLVQNRRTILFFWVFTLPISLMTAFYDAKVSLCVIIFFITLGFLGLEAVINELVDPFGNDPNDFDDVGMTITAFRNVTYTLYDIDGAEAVVPFEEGFATFLGDTGDKEMS